MAELGRVRAGGALAALSLGTFLYVTNEALPIGLMLHMADDLAVSASAVGLLVTGYGAVVVVASIPLTALTARVPRRLLLGALLLGFVVTTVVSAVAAEYWLVMAARLVGALTQALFWAVVVPTAAGLFGPAVRGRALATVYGGASAAVVLGVPAGTWLGEVAGWRSGFLALAVAGVVVLAALAGLLPAGPPERGHATRGARPDRRRYGLTIVVAALATTGAFTAYTYVAPFLTEVGGFSPAAIGPLLLLRGVASLLGLVLAGLVVDRRPVLAVGGAVAVQAVALLGLVRLGERPVATVVLLALTGLSFAALMTALGTRVLEVAPGRSDLASAGMSTAVNVGITGGALAGGLLLPRFGVASTVLAGGLLSLLALGVALAERRLPATRSGAPPPAPAGGRRTGRTGRGAPQAVTSAGARLTVGRGTCQ